MREPVPPVLPDGVTAVDVTAVVVVHRVDPATTEQALASLAASTGVGVHTVVVHNGPAEEWSALVQLCDRTGARPVRSERNEGFGAAVNLGLRVAPADRAVFLLNDDARVEPSTIATCLAALHDAGERCISVAPVVLHHDAPERVDSMGVVVRPNGEGFNAFQGWQRTALSPIGAEVLGPCFSAALFRPGAFTDAVGPVAERYFLYYEDVEWSVRARHRGFISISAPGAVAFHHHAFSTRALGEGARFELVQRNLLLMATAMFEWPTVARIWGSRLVVHGKGVVKGPYRLQRIRALGRAAWHLPWAMRQRRGRGPNPTPDDALFAFSEGHAPAIDTTDFRLTD
jgi:GT2 family glycosyltransferase